MKLFFLTFRKERFEYYFDFCELADTKKKKKITNLSI